METERLLLRRFCADDWEGLFEYLSQKETVKYEPYDVFTEEESRREALRRCGDDAFWAVCLKSSGKLVGNLYLAERDFGAWELGYVFNANCLGRGYATEAARALIGHCFAEKNAHRIVAMCNPLNERSWKLLERLGMRREGVLLQNVHFSRNEQGFPLWQDTYEYAVLRAEWAANAPTTRIVIISGAPGAGKTTIARLLPKIRHGKRRFTSRWTISGSPSARDT